MPFKTADRRNKMPDKISNIMQVTMDKIRSVVDSETIVGDPITVNNMTIIPVSKLTFGVASGGSDFPSKKTEGTYFGGGSGIGAAVTPVGFLVIKGNEVKMLNVGEETTPLERVITSMPETVEKISSLFKSNKETKIEL